MVMLLVLVAMFGIFYFMLIRPQRQRQNLHKDFIESLEAGDQVITAGGIYGEIEEVDGTDVLLKVEDGTRLRLLKTSIMAAQQESLEELEEEEEDSIAGEIEEADVEEESEEKEEE